MQRYGRRKTCQQKFELQDLQVVSNVQIVVVFQFLFVNSSPWRNKRAMTFRTCSKRLLHLQKVILFIMVVMACS
jgi:hypothetical protein